MEIKSRCLLLACASAASLPSAGAERKPDRPNIIIILADDLGYGDTGPYGQLKIETPNIDRLAQNGMHFTRHYAGSAVSAPSRCVLLTGFHTGHAQVRGNDEWASRGPVWNYLAMLADSTLEGQAPMAPGTVTLARLLQQSGYATGMAGKWGLGAPHTESIPNKMGFDFFCGYNCQRQAHTYYPVNLYRNEARMYLGNDTLAPNTKLNEEDDPYNPASYEKFTLKTYSPDVIYSEMTEFIGTDRDSPFFMYWAPTIPHLPLQAPADMVARYVEKFGDEEPYTGNEGYFPARYPHATYAAMVSYLDFQVGQLIKFLKEKNLYDNTVIIFTSDNGPAYNAGTDSPWFKSGGPFRCSRGYGKGSLYEGGIRVPLIVSWPAVIRPGTVSEHQSAFWDLMPTICEIAGIGTATETDGISFLPAMKGEKQQEHDYLYWEFPESGGQLAVITGNYKALMKDAAKGVSDFALFDLAADPLETTDIAAEHPDVIEKVRQIVLREHSPSANPRWRMAGFGD